MTYETKAVISALIFQNTKIRRFSSTYLTCFRDVELLTARVCIVVGAFNFS